MAIDNEDGPRVFIQPLMKAFNGNEADENTITTKNRRSLEKVLEQTPSLPEICSRR